MLLRLLSFHLQASVHLLRLLTVLMVLSTFHRLLTRRLKMSRMFLL